MSIIAAATVVSHPHHHNVPVEIRQPQPKRHHLSLKEEIHLVTHLPLWQRFRNKRIRRLVIGFPLSITMVILCGVGASYSHHQDMVPIGVWDGVAYTLHAIGAIPIVKYSEPFWVVVFGQDS